MVATAAVSGVAVVLTNPFIVLNFSKFKADVLDTAFTEGPAFQSDKSGIVIVLRHAWYYLHAFFTQYAVVPSLAIIRAAVIMLCLAARLKNSGTNDDDRALRRIADMILIVSITLAAYVILQTEININQSRYYIPIGIAVALLFSMSVGVLLIALRRGSESGSYEFLCKAGRALVWITVVCLLGLSVLNGIVHVVVFPLSAKQESARYGAYVCEI